MIGLVKRILTTSPSMAATPGVIIANPGQLIWHRNGKRAVTFQTWQSMPRRNALSIGYRIDSAANRVPGNRSSLEHVSYVFSNVIRELVDGNARLDIIAAAGGLEALGFLDNNCKSICGPAFLLSRVGPVYCS